MPRFCMLGDMIWSCICKLLGFTAPGTATQLTTWSGPPIWKQIRHPKEPQEFEKVSSCFKAFKTRESRLWLPSHVNLIFTYICLPLSRLGSSQPWLFAKNPGSPKTQGLRTATFRMRRRKQTEPFQQQECPPCTFGNLRIFLIIFIYINIYIYCI